MYCFAPDRFSIVLSLVYSFAIQCVFCTELYLIIIIGLLKVFVLSAVLEYDFFFHSGGGSLIPRGSVSEGCTPKGLWRKIQLEWEIPPPEV